MELPKAIKEVVELQGKEILADFRLVNFLTDFKEFEQYPETKFTQRTLVNDGHGQKLLNINADGELKDTKYALTPMRFLMSLVLRQKSRLYVFCFDTWIIQENWQYGT